MELPDRAELFVRATSRSLGSSRSFNIKGDLAALTWIGKNNWSRSSAGITATGRISIGSCNHPSLKGSLFFSALFDDNPRVKRTFCPPAEGFVAAHSRGLYSCCRYKWSATSMIPQRLGSFAQNVQITRISKQAISPFAGSFFCYFKCCKALKSTRDGGNG
jgi:hypothetical protein